MCNSTRSVLILVYTNDACYGSRLLYMVYSSVYKLFEFDFEKQDFQHMHVFLYITTTSNTVFFMPMYFFLYIRTINKYKFSPFIC